MFLCLFLWICCTLCIFLLLRSCNLPACFVDWTAVFVSGWFGGSAELCLVWVPAGLSLAEFNHVTDQLFKQPVHIHWFYETRTLVFFVSRFVLLAHVVQLLTNIKFPLTVCKLSRIKNQMGSKHVGLLWECVCSLSTLMWSFTRRKKRLILPHYLPAWDAGISNFGLLPRLQVTSGVSTTAAHSRRPSVRSWLNILFVWHLNHL